MSRVSTEGATSFAQDKERTLRTACLLSAWAPAALGVALVLGPSTVLIADFIRRTSELLVTAASWRVFRKIARNPSQPPEAFEASERRVSQMVAAVLLMSTVIILITAAIRGLSGAEVGWIVPGLLIACGGCTVNCWLWRRSRLLAKREPSPLIDAQWRFYRSKTIADICVIATLIGGAVTRGTAFSSLVDAVGACIIALFLATTAQRVLQRSASSTRVMAEMSHSDPAECRADPRNP